MPYESKKPVPLEDTSLMPTGKYKGDRMIDIPAKYLLYIYENDLCSPLVKNYISRNLDVIKKQAEQDAAYE